MAADDRVERALAVQKSIFGVEVKSGRRANEPEAAEDLSRLMLEHAFADVWSRPGLDTRTRSFITLSMAIAQDSTRELRNHTWGALRLGITPEEIIEVIIHAAVYCGVAKASGAWSEVRRILAEHAAAASAGEAQ